MTPTARTLKKLREDGRYAQVVERFCHFSKRRIDLMNCIDIIDVGSDIRGIQATSASHVSDRIKKLSDEPRALAWVKAGGRLEVWGWSKCGARGKVKRWACRIVRATVLPGGDNLCWSEES